MTMARFQEDSPLLHVKKGLLRLHTSRLVENVQEGNGDLTYGAKNVLLQEDFVAYRLLHLTPLCLPWTMF